MLSTLFGEWGVGLLAQASGSFWMPRKASSLAGEVDSIFNFILWISVFFFVLIVGLMVVFILRYRQQDPDDMPEESPSHNNALELTWTLIPVVLVVVIFTFGFKGYLGLTVPPSDAYEVLVTAQKWNWQFTYPNGHTDHELHIPEGRSVRLVMQSEDVIHSFYVPAFRVKQDVVPGRYTKVWFEATETGEFPILCAEYCGTGHSDMITKVIVHPALEFDGWLASAGDFLDNLPPAEAGAMLFKSLGCTACHSSDGSPLVGPTMLGVYGTERALKGGGSVVFDEEYIRSSLLDPQGQISEGYDPVMPTFQGRVNDKEITVIIAFIKSLSE